MPTPSDDHILPPVAVIHTAADAGNARHGCPPEDRREAQHTSSEEHVETPDSPAGAEGTTGVEHESIEPVQAPTPEHDANDGTLGIQEALRRAHARSTATLEEIRRASKAVQAEDAIEAPSPSAIGLLSPPPDGDYKAAQLAQSMSNTVISPGEDEGEQSLPLYLHYPDLELNRHTTSHSTTSILRPGSKFRGTQQSDRQVYDVQVELKDVDLAESTLCGYLRIQGLTDDHPTLTTFFEGEIIGPKYLFRTSHPSWGSSEKVDLQHWARFPPWRGFTKSAKHNPNFTLSRPWEEEHMFMRWKEYFLVPDHRVKTISGASFEGFYYICFNQASGKVSGIYFHAKSEKYQQLELVHDEDRGCGAAVEFR